MKYSFKIISLSALLFLGSCKDFLDTKPVDFLSPENYYTTEEHLNRALVSVYDVLGSNLTYGSNMLGQMGLDADQMFFSRNVQTGVSVYDVAATDQLVSGVWQTFYDGINRANVLLQNIDKPDMDEAKRDVIEGEARFLRAYFYFILVSNFGDVPLKTQTNTSPDETFFPRTPKLEVYEFIVNEMKEAEKMVTTAGKIGFGGRVSKSAVRGILARVYLYMAGYPLNLGRPMYEEAKTWALKVMDPDEDGFQHALNPDFKQVFINYAQNIYDVKESIWEVEFWGYADGTYTESKRVGSNNGIRAHHADVESNNEIGYAYGHILATANQFRLYKSYTRTVGSLVEEYSPDTRRDWTIAPFWYGSSHTSLTKVYWPNTNTSELYRRYSGKWRREYELITPRSKNDTPQNYPLLRFSDVLLMFAEAENELNGPDDAYEAINMVKRRAYGVDPLTAGLTDEDGQLIDEAGLSQLGMQTYIRNERSRELAYENLRKGDLVRWGEFYKVMSDAGSEMQLTGPSSFSGHTRYFTNVKPRDEVWPIPAREIGLNKGLVQNTGW